MTYLTEGDKSRFFKTWDSVIAKDKDSFHIIANTDPDYEDRNPPTKEEIIDFANSNAGANLNVNWNKFPKQPELKKLVDGYYKYQDTGTRKQRASRKYIDPKLMFKSTDLKCVDEGQDCSGCDVVFINSLENSNFIFMTPLTHKACVFMDSFECGGQGAKWCIGQEDDTSAWRSYTRGRTSIFCLAYRKGQAAENERKYMIQLAPSLSNTQAWTQDDNVENTISVFKFDTFFDHPVNKILDTVLTAVMPYDNVYRENGEGQWWVEGSGNEEFLYDEKRIQAFKDKEEKYQKSIIHVTEVTRENCLEKIKYHKQFASTVNIDLDGTTLNPSVFRAEGPDGELDLAKLLKVCHEATGSQSMISFKNGKIKDVIWNPQEAGNSKDGVFVNRSVTIDNVYNQDYHKPNNNVFDFVSEGPVGKVYHVTFPGKDIYKSVSTEDCMYDNNMIYAVGSEETPHGIRYKYADKPFKESRLSESETLFKKKIVEVFEDLGFTYFKVKPNFAEVWLENGQVVAISVRDDCYRVDWYSSETQYQKNIKRGFWEPETFQEITYVFERFILKNVDNSRA